MASIRGRGYGRGLNDSPNAQALRRPGEAGIMQRFGRLSPTEPIKNNFEDEISEICEKITKLDFNNTIELSQLSEKVKSICQSVDNMEKCIETIFQFALKSKWNAHISALFCNNLGDIVIVDEKFRTHLLRKLQATYKERNKKYLELENFLMDVTFLCEIYHHIRIEGICLKVLSRPIIDYFGMLVDGASQKEVEIFAEQFPKCYKNLKANDQDGLEILVCKLRKQIISSPSNFVVKTMLLEAFENALTDFKPLSENAKNLYESLSKPIIRICD